MALPTNGYYECRSSSCTRILWTRTYRDEYMSDREKGVNYHTTEEWQDECRASITAAKSAPGLTQKDKSDLVMDAVYRADEYNHYIEMDGFMKEAVYGYTDEEKNIAYDVRRINYVSKESTKGNEVDRDNNSESPKCGSIPKITTSSRGERLTVSCECGYVFDSEMY